MLHQEPVTQHQTRRHIVHPVICFDERPYALHAQPVEPLPPRPAQPAAGEQPARATKATVHRQFTLNKARVKLNRHY